MPSSPWLTLGRSYTVLEMLTSRAGEWMRAYLRVMTDEDMPACCDPLEFEIVSDHIPSLWAARISAHGDLDIGPASWRVPGFWDRYFDGEPEALAGFKMTYEMLLGDSGWATDDDTRR